MLCWAVFWGPACTQVMAGRRVYLLCSPRWFPARPSGSEVASVSPPPLPAKENKTKVRRGQEGWINSLTALADEITHSNNKQVTPRHVALPESSPGLFWMVPRPPPASKPSSSQYGVGLCSWPFAHQGPFAPQLLGSRIQIPFPGVQTHPWLTYLVQLGDKPEDSND